MGPRRDWRGYDNEADAILEAMALQWGHAVIGVDTGFCVVPPTTVSSLQWGHAVIGVDTIDLPNDQDSLQLVLQWGHAVIGVDTAAVGLQSWRYSRTLQWGHAVIGVDTKPA